MFSLSLVDQHAELFKVFTKNKRWQLQKLNKSGPVFDLRDISATTLVAKYGEGFKQIPLLAVNMLIANCIFNLIGQHVMNGRHLG